MSFAEHSRRALATTYAELGLAADANADAAVLLGSVGNWPLWPDVTAGLPALGNRHRVGVLSNVDDDLFARTQVNPLVDGQAVLTSQRLGAYKPSPEIYRPARERAGGALVHVATSGRTSAAHWRPASSSSGCVNPATGSIPTDPSRRSKSTTSQPLPRRSATRGAAEPVADHKRTIIACDLPLASAPPKLSYRHRAGGDQRQSKACAERLTALA